jgi:general secretion pathway protein D
MDEALYYEFFLNVLEVYGYTALEMDNGIIKIDKSADGRKKNVPVLMEGEEVNGDLMITRVVRVKNVSVQELGPVVRQFSDQKGGSHVAQYTASNVMMLTGHAATVNRLVKVIKQVDQAGDKSVDIVKLNFATASDVVSVVETIYKPAAGGKNNIPAFLIPRVVADDRTNSVIVSGEGEARERAIELIMRLDNELESQGNTKVFYLNYAKAEDLVKVLQGVSKSINDEKNQGKKGSSSRKNNQISIEAHEDTNSLVITANPDIMRSLKGVISDLDVRRAQVLVEAIIVEVLEGDGINFGLQWASEQGGLVQFNNGSMVPIGSAIAAAEVARDKTVTDNVVGTESGTATQVDRTVEGNLEPLANVLSSISGLALGVAENDWAAIVQAVAQDTKSNILATPSVTTMDNEEASMLVGQEVPILTGSTSSSSNSNPFQTVERKEVGVKLKVTPQINEGTAVQLKIEQEVSSVSGATAVDISINKRTISNTVLADDGSMIILGGLIDENVQESVQKVPLLGDIPLLGQLFKSTSSTKQKRNLLVFIRATILRDTESMNKLSHRKYNFIRGEQVKRQEDGINLMPFKEPPVLPEWNDALVLPPSYEEYLHKENEKNKQDD